MSSKKFYAVLPINHKLSEMEVIMLSTTISDAKKLFVLWNGGGFELTPHFLKTKKILWLDNVDGKKQIQHHQMDNICGYLVLRIVYLPKEEIQNLMLIVSQIFGSFQQALANYTQQLNL